MTNTATGKDAGVYGQQEGGDGGSPVMLHAKIVVFHISIVILHIEGLRTWFMVEGSRRCEFQRVLMGADRQISFFIIIHTDVGKWVLAGTGRYQRVLAGHVFEAHVVRHVRGPS